MEIIHKCENCIWFDQCHENEICDNYTPASTEELEDMDMSDYNGELRIRNSLYQRQVNEQSE